jgi:hypothetical protein
MSSVGMSLGRCLISLERLPRHQVVGVIAEIPSIEMCPNGRIIGRFSSDDTIPVACASEVEFAFYQVLNFVFKLPQVS